jgi:hypothetical protein
MRVLLVSTYELGHQPLHVASPAAALRKAGHEVRCLDLSVERWDAGALEWAQAVGFSVPMHTAMRLAMRAAAGVRRAPPSCRSASTVSTRAAATPFAMEHGLAAWGELPISIAAGRP